MKSIAQWKVEKRLTLSALTRLESFYQKYKDTPQDIDAVDLRRRLSSASLLLQKFNDIVVMLATEEEKYEFESDIGDFEERYYNIIRKLEIFLETSNSSTRLNSSITQSDPADEAAQSLTTSSQIPRLNTNDLTVSSETFSNQTQIPCSVVSTNQIPQTASLKLPHINVPKFSGHYTEWLPFRNTFESLIHQNQTISTIEKFHHFKNSVSGDAAETISSLSLSEENYTIAWSLLQERFENKRLIVNHHLNNSFNLPHTAKDSASSLRQIINIVTNNLKALTTLNLKTDEWDCLIIHLINIKLDFITKRGWEESLTPNQLPTLANLIQFLNQRAQTLEALEMNKTTKPISQFKKSVSLKVAVDTATSCALCKSNHQLYKCPSFLKLDEPARLTEAKRLKLCTNCLRGKHNTNTCRGSNCRICNKKHNSLLHVSSNNADDITDKEPSSNILSALCQKQRTQIILSTAIVKIQDAKGSFQKCRVLLDAGSQSNFITSQCLAKLGLPFKKVNIPICGITQTSANVSQIAKLQLNSIYNNFSTIINCLVLPQITDLLPSSTFSKNMITIPKDIQLADPDFNLSRPIDILIGAELFWQLLQSPQIHNEADQPVFQNTKLGWIVGGTLQSNKQRQRRSLVNLSLTESVERFWEIENVAPPEQITRSFEEIACEQHFVSTTQRDQNGNFIVRLPFKNNAPVLGDSYLIAKQRFFSLERRLLKNATMRSDYSKFIEEYSQLNHMTLTDNNDKNNYLPHHAVIKEDSLTTKLRVVFDGSAKTSNNISLNDILMVGPTIQRDLFSIIIRFRCYQFVFTADISKMYRQIWIHPADRKYQCILWRSNPDEPLRSYELNTVTYGTASAPFSAVRCLDQLAQENKDKFLLAHNAIVNDFYIDDVLTGSDSIDKVIKLRDELITVLGFGGFHLSKWASNRSEVLPTAERCQTNSIVTLDKMETKTLGVMWNTETDKLKYAFTNIQTRNKITKRHILSETSKLFDPLGLTGPTIVMAKILIQKLWSLKLNWDESVPPKINAQWEKLVTQFPMLNNLQISRKVIDSKYTQRLQIHGFSDASMSAYGAAIYIRSTDKDKKHSVQLLCAKSRVAPLKPTTLPRLELCAAMLMVELMEKVCQIVPLKFNKKFYWTDSTIVLAWISAPADKFKIFVGNRIAEIQSKTSKDEWRHVKSEENPSDIISRGMLPEQLINSNLWWHGPKWLTQNRDTWPQLSLNTKNDNLAEQKTKRPAVHNSTLQEDLVNKFSSLTRLQRVFAHCCRFIHNCKPNNQKCRKTGSLSVKEQTDSLNKIIKQIQIKHFPEEHKTLKAGKSIEKSSSLLSLSPFLGDDELIRVGGRLANLSTACLNKKHPIILPGNANLTKLIIMHEHLRHLHAGNQATLAAIRERFWILTGRSAIRKVLSNCVKCFRVKPIVSTPKMGNLPAYRIKPSRPFQNCGVDYAGPTNIKEGRARGKIKSYKAYIALFVCLATKAVHIDLVSDCTSQSFLKTIKRFIARRGMVANMYSDNGTNFVGAQRELIELKKLFKDQEFEKEVISPLSTKGISWHFLPPRAPHMGGIWESGIKSVKHHLKRMTSEALLTFEDMTTLLAQIEACLNSRPLVPLSSDPNDLSVLTPGHFLIGCPLTSLQEPDITEVRENRLSTLQRITRLKQGFWKRWSKEYIGELQQRVKWRSQHKDLAKIGSVVVIKEDNLPPLVWKLGRIVKLHPGKDSITRVVSVQTSSGAVLQRAVTKICVLPIEN